MTYAEIAAAFTELNAVKQETTRRIVNKRTDADLKRRRIELVAQLETAGAFGLGRAKLRQLCRQEAAMKILFPEHLPAAVVRQLIINQPDQTPATQEEVPNE